MKCAVLGYPINHSLSPTIHLAAYEAMGLDDWEYEAVLVHGGGLGEYVDGLDDGWRGLSLTMPLKREALALLDSRDEWVEATGVCNTLLLQEDGTRHGLNTDVLGALDVLEAHDAPRGRAVVLGAGATAASVLVALAERGLEHATVVAREPERATATISTVTAHGRAPEIEVVTFDDLAEGLVRGDVLVSTVPASVQTLDVQAATSDVPLVFDVVYEPWPTPLAAAAERQGRHVVSGLDLIVAQAAHQVRAMTGRDDVPVEKMREAAAKVLDDRR